MIDTIRAIPEETQLLCIWIGVLIILLARAALISIKRSGRAHYTWHAPPQTSRDRAMIGCIVGVANLALVLAVAVAILETVKLMAGA